MILRTSGDLSSPSGLRPRRFRLPAVLAGAVAVLLTLLAGGSGAGISAYQGTLYFAGPASSISGSYQLTTTMPAAQGTTPSVVAGVSGSGGLAAGSYRWIYVTSSGGAYTASLTSNQLSLAANTPAIVSNVPVGADVYRATIPGGTSTGTYTYVGTNAGPTTTYTDTNTSTSGAVLPQADTRVPLSTTGWMPFVPGSNPGAGNSSAGGSTPSIPSTCTGWTVDSSAGLTFPAGTWTFQRRLRADAAASGGAVLSVAMWKVDTSGNTISGGTIVPVTDGGAIALNGTTQTVSVSYTTTSATTLDTNERLCVQFWRHQTAPTTSGGGTSRTVWLLAWDPNSRVSMHPAPNAFATAALSSPADGLHTQTTPTLSAAYADTEGDSGTITLRLCSDSGCGTPLADSGALAANNGETKSWTPSSLGDGTYYWQAQARDAGGLPSAWTSSRSFVVDTTAPTTSIDSSPPASSNAVSGTIAFSANESVSGFQCHVDTAAWAACSSPYSYGPLADGSHTFYVKATADLAGNAGTTTSYGWTVDTVPPDTAITSKPSSLSTSSSPSFSFTATQSGSTFECSLDGAGFTACATPQTYAGVADGPHTFRVRAVDPAGNADASPSSYSWTIDATPPDTSIGPSYPATPTTATGATFDFSASETGSTFACSLDGAAFASCSTPKAYSALGDGTHTFQVRATDTAGNTDPSPASHTWTIDTTPPVTSIGPTMPAAHTSATSATFDLGSNEGGSTFECRLDGAPFASCSTPKTYSGLADGSHTFAVRATDAVGNVDTSPALYTWQIDNVAPTSSLTTPPDATLTNAPPQLGARFDDATAGGDSGTVEFRICSASAPAGTACVPVVQAATSGTISNGATATWIPAALADGTYQWQARAQDAAGNYSGWTATRGFQLDTAVPVVTADAPADNAAVRTVELRATFTKPSFLGSGTVEFRLCANPLCLVVARSSSVGVSVNGAQVAWSPATPLADGLWYWQVRGSDAAGNTSAWSQPRALRVDTVAPKAPTLSGTVGNDGLTLHIAPPDDNVANYVLFVDGLPWKNLATTQTDVNVGSFDESDTRTFAVLAVDTAGNVGALSHTLVGVPNLLGLDWTHARAATSARGLELQRDAIAFASIPMFVTSQTPTAPALAEQGGTVRVTMAAAAGAPLAVQVRPGSVRCHRSCLLRLRVDLSSAALVRSRLLGRNGKLLSRAVLGQLHAGATTVRVKLPARLRRGAYRLVFDARGEAGAARALVWVRVA